MAGKSRNLLSLLFCLFGFMFVMNSENVTLAFGVQPSHPSSLQSNPRHRKLAAAQGGESLSAAPQDEAQKIGKTIITAIASDIDGTLLNSKQQVSQRNVETIQRARKKGILFFPATGKSRQGVYNALGEFGQELKKENCPGVFLQGLIVYDQNGNVIHEMLLPLEPVKKVVQFCTREGISLVAYHRDRILCSQRDANTDKLINYCEPTPEAIGPLDEAMVANGQVYNKLIIMGNDEDQITKIRPAMEALIGEDAEITQAIGYMLEILPKGGSKGDGVRRLLGALGVDPAGLLALGDAENDVDMLRLAGTGVAMGNARPALFAVTGGRRTATHDRDGVARAVGHYCLGEPDPACLGLGAVREPGAGAEAGGQGGGAEEEEEGGVAPYAA